jgi:hypothetical protein
MHVPLLSSGYEIAGFVVRYIDEIRMFEALFKVVSTRFGIRTIEKSVEKFRIASFVPPCKLFVWGA